MHRLLSQGTERQGFVRIWGVGELIQQVQDGPFLVQDRQRKKPRIEV